MNYNLQDYWITILHVKLAQYCKETTLHFLKRNVWIISPLWVIALSCWRGLCNSMKLWAMLCRATQDRGIIVKSSDKMWSTGEGNGNPLQCSCLENPRDGGAWWAAIYGIAQSPTQLKQLSSSSTFPYKCAG